MYREKHTRSLLKMFSWRVWATITTMVIVYLFIGKVEVALSVGAVEVVMKMVLYYLHERVWDRIMVGRHTLKPFVLWFTGLPSSGKSTLARKTYDFLSRKGYKVEKLDGDAVRSIFPGTGFTREERDRHIKRVGFLASILEKNGVIVISSFISPYQESREFVKKLCSHFIEVHVATPLAECERRDVKGLYKKAREGVIQNFTGISDPYEPPQDPQIVLDTSKQSIGQSFAEIRKYIGRYI